MSRMSLPRESAANTGCWYFVMADIWAFKFRSLRECLSVLRHKDTKSNQPKHLLVHVAP